MRADILGRIRNTNLPKSKPLLPLFEAVMNSFQAIEDSRMASGHEISIIAKRQGDILDKEKPSGLFEAFTITDTGIGFTDDNFRSFDTMDSTYKLSRGGKGIGRFLWLKAFTRVEINSHYKEGDEYLCRSFEFQTKDEELLATSLPSKRTAPLTAVNLIGFRSPYREECPRTLEVIAQHLVAHFLPMFLDPDGPSLSITEDGSPALDLRNFFRENFQSFASARTFIVGNQNFSLIGFRLHAAIADHNELVYGAAFREVISERLGRYLPNLRGRLIDNKRGSFSYLAFIQSPFFDERVNNERTDFSIPRDPVRDTATPGAQGQVDILADEISLKDIREAALKAITEDLQPYLDEINTSKEAALTRFVAEDGPHYRALLKHMPEFIDQIPVGAGNAELDMVLHRQLHQWQVKLKQEGQRIIAEAAAVKSDEADAFYRRFEKFVSDENEIGKTALAQYVVHRRVIVDLLEGALSINADSGRYALEKAVHSLVFPMRATSDDVPFEQQNLWIIDERLTFHSFLSSDQPLSELSVLHSESDDRPDLFVLDIVNHAIAFSEDKDPVGSIVVIEFKKPERKGYKEDPVSQVYRLIRDLRDGDLKDKGGRRVRPANQNIPAFCYIMCDLTPGLETMVQNMGGRRTPDNLGYYGYNETLNAYYEVISYAKLLSDAKKRNRILFEKLHLPTTG